MKNQKYWSAALLTVGLIASLGCVSSTTGKEGNLEFSYSADDDFANFNKPIAVGAKLDLRVYKAGTEGNRDATVEAASSSDDGVLAIGERSGNTVTLLAKGAGSAEISVTALLAATNESVTDAVDMMARVPEIHNMSHACLSPQEREGYYLIGQDIYIPHDFKLKDGQNVIGYGYFPVVIEPAQALTLKTNHRDQIFLHMTTGATATQATVTSELDGTKLTLNLVEEAQIDSAVLSGLENSVTVNQQQLAYALPAIGQKPICQAQSEYSIETLTPEVCEVTKAANISEEQQRRQSGWIVIKGKSVGDCDFKVTYPKGNNGQGLSAELTTPINAN